MSADHLERLKSEENQPRSFQYLWYGVPIVLMAALMVMLLINYHKSFSIEGVRNGLNSDFVIFLLIGIFAQLVDGTLGMGYGATSTSFLISFGVPPGNQQHGRACCRNVYYRCISDFAS